jgi:hypothetical protein
VGEYQATLKDIQKINAKTSKKTRRFNKGFAQVGNVMYA